MNAAHETAKANADSKASEDEAKATEEAERRAALDSLRARYPDLARKVEADEIGLRAAKVEADERDEKDRTERRRHTGYLNDALRLFHGYSGATPDEWAAKIHRFLDPEYFVGGNDVAMDGKTMRRAAATLTALADRLEAEERS